MWQFGYDNLIHLVWAKDEPTDGGSPTLIATYIYDTFGNRIEKDVWSSTGGNLTTRFGYDGEQVWTDLNGSNQLLTRYLEGDQAGPPLARISSAGFAGWYLADHLGSVRNLTDNSGTLIDTIAYDAYGKLTNETSPSNGDRYKWATLQFDNETGLYHAWARDELPPVGRWLEQDPLGFSAGDYNLYRYVRNEPISETDASGYYEAFDAYAAEKKKEGFTYNPKALSPPTFPDIPILEYWTGPLGKLKFHEQKGIFKRYWVVAKSVPIGPGVKNRTVKFSWKFENEKELKIAFEVKPPKPLQFLTLTVTSSEKTGLTSETEISQTFTTGENEQLDVVGALEHYEIVTGSGKKEKTEEEGLVVVKAAMVIFRKITGPRGGPNKVPGGAPGQP